MAIERFIATGDKNLEARDYLGAIEAYTSAIKENPKAFKAYIKRAIAYQRFKNYERAKTDISEAFSLAHERGRREELAECYYRIGIIYYSEKSYKLALTNLKRAQEYGCKETALATWVLKAESDVKKEDPDYKGEELPQKPDMPEPLVILSPLVSQKQSEGSTSFNTINKQAPLKVKIRDDWYQTNEEVIITIYAKKVDPQTLKIQYHEQFISVSFPNGVGSEYNYNLEPLYGAIDPKASSHAVKSTKIEITLVKQQKGKWPTLEASSVASGNSEVPSDKPLTYPSSAKKTINWANFNVDDGEEEANQNENDFFAKLYKDTDDDTRKAMMKSFQESNGTVLTTDWSDAQSKTFEPSPPEGMETKKW